MHKLRHCDGLPEFRGMTVHSDAVSQNAMCAANAAVNVIAELLAGSQPIKTWLLHESLQTITLIVTVTAV